MTKATVASWSGTTAALGSELVPTGVDGEQKNWFKWDGGLVEIDAARGLDRFTPTVAGWYYFEVTRNHSADASKPSATYYNEATKTRMPFTRGWSRAITGGVNVT